MFARISGKKQRATANSGVKKGLLERALLAKQTGPDVALSDTQE
jgi:hypothetical protein